MAAKAAGYSGTPLARKLGIRESARVLLLGPPQGFIEALDPLPPAVTFAHRPTAAGPFDVVVAFAVTLNDFRTRFASGAAKLAPAGGLWVAWPKKASGVPTQLDENTIRALGLESGLVDNKVCAIDDTWSGLRFVIRLKNRPAPKPPKRTP